MGNPAELEDGEYIEFYPRGERRSGGLFASHDDVYEVYGDIWVMGPDGHERRRIASEVYKTWADRWIVPKQLLEQHILNVPMVHAAFSLGRAIQHEEEKKIMAEEIERLAKHGYIDENGKIREVAKSNP